MARLFGTDGIRGVAGATLDCGLVFELGRAGAHVLTQGNRRPRILVGRDTRISGTMLQNALCAGICSMGGEVYTCGIMPTPAVAYLTKTEGMDAGVMITASHNPFEDNGIKFFNTDGFKLHDTIEDEIEGWVKKQCQGIPPATGAGIGSVRRLQRAHDDYFEFLSSRVTEDLSRLRVVLDCANGAASTLAPKLFADLGIDTIPLFSQPNGRNVNDRCGSTHPEILTRVVKDMGADIGLAFDGDADRMLAVDAEGGLVCGDRILAICAQEMKHQGKLRNNTLVATVMSNLGLTLACKRMGIHLEKTAVGDRYVLERMLENRHSLGGEQSGHVIFLDENTTGDGLLTGLHLLQVMARSKASLRELCGVMEVFPQVLINVRVGHGKKDAWQDDAEITAAVETTEARYSGKGRVLVRSSGTEDVVRVMIEGQEKQAIETDAAALAALVEKKLG